MKSEIEHGEGTVCSIDDVIDGCKAKQTGSPNDPLVYFTYVDDRGRIILFGYVYYFFNDTNCAKAIVFDTDDEDESGYSFVDTVVTHAFLRWSSIYLTEFEMFHNIDEKTPCRNFPGGFPDSVCRILEFKRGLKEVSA